MIIFLVLILLLLVVIAAFIYLNKQSYYEIKPPQIALQDAENIFSPDADYFTLKDSWIELKTGSIMTGQPCYSNSNCFSNVCRQNPDTNQNKCFDTVTDATAKGFTDPAATDIPNYGTPILYTAICSQQSTGSTAGSYYPNFKSQKLINESLSTAFNSNCLEYTFQQTPLGETKCYDSDQLAGTKIVEMCQAAQGTNQICINNDGERVYSPDLNSLYIKPSITLCEDNTSVNYITFNFNKVPQTISVLTSNEDTKPLQNNQIYSLSVDTVTYYPEFTVNQISDTQLYVSFTGTWGYKYNYTIDTSDQSEKTFASSSDYSGLSWYDTTRSMIYSDTSEISEITGRLDIDFTYGINYIIPAINNISITNSNFQPGLVLTTEGLINTSNSIVPLSSLDGYTDNLSVTVTNGTISTTGTIDLTSSSVTNIVSVSQFTNNEKVTISGTPTVLLSSLIDPISQYDKHIASSISLQPCAMFDTSYDMQSSDNLKKLTTYNTNGEYVDKQKFKVSRFSMDQGKLTANPQGMVGSIVYRNLNYENGGLYLDYYVPPISSQTSPSTLPSITTEGLVLRKVNPGYTDPSKVWILMPPISLSPYTIPSAKNRWCNYAFDSSSDGGNTFNNKNGFAVPMFSQNIPVGTELIDPEYNPIESQPDNALFNAIGTGIEGAAIAASAIITGGAVGLARAGIEIYELAQHEQFHWENVDPSFHKCANICTDTVSTIPENKAVAVTPGTLGSNPPGHGRGITQEFAQGDVLFGHSVGGVTCQYYYLYESNTTNNPLISSMEVGDSYKSGNTVFNIESTYNNTYLFTTNYFNNNTVVTINSIPTAGTGYGLAPLPENVITSLTASPQKFIINETTSDYTLPTTICSTSIVSTGSETCIISPTINSSDLTTIINDITGNLTKLDWFIDVTQETSAGGTTTGNIPLTVSFQNLYSDNPTTGGEPFYIMSSVKIGIPAADVTSGSASNILQISSETVLDQYFPSISDTKTTTYEVITNVDTHHTYLFNTLGKKLSLTAKYGNFVREYRLYSGSIFVALVDIKTLANGVVDNSSPDNITILTVVDNDSIVTGINTGTPFDLQEWWTLDFTYLTTKIKYEYHNTTATGCTVVLSDNDTTWEVTEPAPRNLLEIDENTISFQNTTDPISLLNNSVMKHGDSPQQLVYTSSYEDTNIFCYNTYNSLSSEVTIGGVSITSSDLPSTVTNDDIQNAVVTTCNSNPKCNYDTSLGYCTGKDLKQYVSELYGDVFTSSEKFNPGIFNTKETLSHFTEITFLKSLQIKELNYQEYVALPKQNKQGASPTTYYTPPQFINYSNQNIQNLGDSIPTVKLGKYIPYQYFYPTFLNSGAEKSNLIAIDDNKSIVNNFYINLNYTQFIPYGKKSLYENGFTEQSDVPTF